MIYYKKLEDRIEKYSIISDKIMLMELRKLVIDTCSDKTHIIQKNSSIIPKIISTNHEIRNLNVNLIHDSKFEQEKKYDIEYDCYQYPYLIHIIDGILSGDSSVLNELYSPTIDKKSVQERIAELCSEMLKNIDGDKEELSSQLKQLDELRSFDSNQISPLSFYKNVRSSLTIELEDIMLKSEIDRFANFFKDNTELLNNEIKKNQKINIK